MLKDVAPPGTKGTLFNAFVSMHIGPAERFRDDMRSQGKWAKLFDRTIKADHVHIPVYVIVCREARPVGTKVASRDEI